MQCFLQVDDRNILKSSLPFTSRTPIAIALPLTAATTTSAAAATIRLKRALEVDAMCRAETETPCGFVVARVCKEVNRAIFQALGERRRQGVSGSVSTSGGGDDVGVPDVALVLQLVRSTKTLIGWQRRYHVSHPLLDPYNTHCTLRSPTLTLSHVKHNTQTVLATHCNSLPCYIC